MCETSDLNQTCKSGLNTTITNAGGTSLYGYGQYWSSTEYDEFSCYYVDMGFDGLACFNYYGNGIDSRVRAAWRSN